jgi:hypothetical protein
MGVKRWRRSKCSISADVEVIPIQKANEAYDRMVRADVKYRFWVRPPDAGETACPTFGGGRYARG